MKKMVVCLLLLICNLALFPADAVKRSLSVDDALNLVSVSDIKLSPDGTRIFYALERLDWDKNKNVKTYYMCGADGQDRRVFLRKDLEARRFAFSPGGKYLGFLSKTKKTQQVFLIRVDGGEAQPLTAHAVDIKTYRWLPDAGGLVFLADQARPKKEQKEYDLGADAVFVDEAPNGKENARFSRIWHFDLKTKKESIVCKEDLVIEAFDVSPDGKRLVFTAVPDTRTNYPHLAELYVIHRDGTGLRRLTHNKGPEEDPKWSPDGSKVIFHAPYRRVEKGTFDLHIGYFWLWNGETGEFRRLESQQRGEMYRGASRWSPDGKYFYFNELHGTDTNLYRINIKKDKLETMTHVTGTLRPKSFSKDMKKMAYTIQDYKTPPDLYVSDLRLKKPVRITDANPWFRKDILVSSGGPVRWRSKKDGLEMEGMFLLPPNRGKDKKAPLIVHIHGGPAGVIENAFRPQFQIFAGLGYAVLGPNFRGSTGYGDKILRGLMGEVGAGEHDDIMSGVDYVLENYFIDPERMAVRGWSWGGVSTGYLVTHVHRFKAAVAGAGVYDWAAENGPGYSYDVTLWYIGGTPWDNPREWAKRSAITHAKNVRTPILLLHGGNDTVSSVNQSLMYYTALREIGKAPVRYIKFPRQGHGIDEPRLKRIRGIEEIRWIKKYMEGVDWQPGERK
jgi:dipeptidyl aminopeptidase/acylaminoacyl peptidase